MHSEGLDDPGCRGLASIMVNGVEYCLRKRGHNVVVLDQCGSVVSSENFDTTQQKESESMARFLNDIPKDHIALVAVQETTGKMHWILWSTQFLQIINISARNFW